jgi:hypothetical protein
VTHLMGTSQGMMVSMTSTWLTIQVALVLWQQTKGWERGGRNRACFVALG